MEKDVFDYIDEVRVTRPSNRTSVVWNIATTLVVLTTLCMGIVFLAIFVNPYVGFNPFPPPEMPELLVLPTLTPTPKSVLPPTWTPTPTEVATATNTPVPTVTGVAVEITATEESPTDGEIQPGGASVVLHEGSPQYIPAISFHPDVGCNWMGVAGQVQDMIGAPVLGLIIEVGGTLAGKPVGNPTILQATGLAKAYGEGGYEVKLADEPIASYGTLWIQVLDQAGLPLSEKVYFETRDTCEENLVIIYFKQIK